MESPVSARKLSKPLGALSALVMGVAMTAVPAAAHAEEADTKAPIVTVKSGDSFTVVANGDYEKVSFSLQDAGKIDKVVLNGVTKDLSNNIWSDLNHVKPGVFGAIHGENTLEVYDVAGNVTTHTFVLNPQAPTVTVKEGDTFTATDGAAYEKVSFKLTDAGKVDKVVLNGVVKDLANDKWSDLNYVKPGVFGAVLGENTLEVYDVAGNVTTVHFTLSATGPSVTIKDNATYTVADGDAYELISFKLFDEGKVDRVVVNGVVKDLSNNKWSDLNYVKPGAFGGVLGENTLVAYDISGNSTTVNFTLVEPMVAAGTPSITSHLPRGRIKQGAELTVNEGDWAQGAQLTYQWFRDGEAVEGETGQMLHLKGGRWPAGTVITVEVTGSLDGHRPAVASTTVVATR
ncbi:hypothetical protein NF556_06480 [Ornithinimicrobium faecis]|uniref:Ig-like domain-containing protein n=1 Tax=Ornithinimicrobium faecis TaxID=2934158 RepID=A0ABY4YXE7_9MICO|nr:hypothetical protein [Ornithinimicrobium sp. HY1793]USQ81287.1 hypothetical protein NF556_06480 [Ornithinimicrobium sp. HY1793]